MNRKLFHVKSRSAPRPGQGKPSPPQKLVSGVPLPRLIKRTLLKSPEVVMVNDPRSIHAEKFRRLKTTLVHMGEAQPRVIVVSSGVPREGKTTTSLNLALTFAADSDDRTLLIDADLRRGTLGRFVTPAPHIGLSHLLEGLATEEHAILSLEGTSLKLLPAGDATQDPLDLLGTGAMGELLRSLRDRFDRIIIDTPPLALFSDADAIGPHTDGILLVARAGATEVSTYKMAIDAVTSTRILGAVLNDVGRGSLADWGKYHGRYSNKYYDSYYYKDKSRS